MVESTGLENREAFVGLEGSNPSLSAINLRNYGTTELRNYSFKGVVRLFPELNRSIKHSQSIIIEALKAKTVSF